MVSLNTVPQMKVSNSPLHGIAFKAQEHRPPG